MQLAATASPWQSVVFVVVHLFPETWRTWIDNGYAMPHALENYLELVVTLQQKRNPFLDVLTIFEKV